MLWHRLMSSSLSRTRKTPARDPLYFFNTLLGTAPLSIARVGDYSQRRRLAGPRLEEPVAGPAAPAHRLTRP